MAFPTDFLSDTMLRILSGPHTRLPRLDRIEPTIDDYYSNPKRILEVPTAKLPNRARRGETTYLVLPEL